MRIIRSCFAIFEKSKKEHTNSSSYDEACYERVAKPTKSQNPNMHTSSTSVFSTFSKNGLRSSARLGLKALAVLALAVAFAASSLAQTPTPTCPPGWAAGPAFPAVAVVRAPGNYFPGERTLLLHRRAQR